MEQGTKIANLAEAFIRKFRISIILLIAIISVGLYSYQNLLPRDGFPSIEIPLTSVQVMYFINDPDVLDANVLKPVEKLLLREDYVKSVTSSTEGNVGNFFIELTEGNTSEGGTKLVETLLEENFDLPEGATISYREISVDSIDGVNDILFALYSESASLDEVQEKANVLATSLGEVTEFTGVNVKEAIVSRVNPVTGKEAVSEESFTRIGIKDGDGIKFYPAINIGIVADDGLSSLDLSELVQTEVNELLSEAEFDGYEVEFNGDNGVAITEQIESLESNFLSGMIAVAIVLILFVNWRASIVALIFIPTVLTLTFIGMALLGSTLNVISLFALVLALGLLVDDAIVVIEAIDRNKREGLKGIDAVRKSLKEIGIADVLGTLTTVLVFAPMLFISGVLGEFISEMPRTIILVLLFSLIIALTIIPLITNWLIPDRKEGKTTGIALYASKINDILDVPSKAVYEIGGKVASFVNFSLSNWITTAVTIILSIVFIAVGFVYAGKLFSERFNPFPPTKDANQIQVNVNFAEGVDLAAANGTTEAIEEYIEENYSQYLTRVDYYSADSRSVLSVLNLTDLNSRDKTALSIADELQSEFEELANAELSANLQSGGPPASEFPFTMQVYSDDYATLEKLSNDIADYISDVEMTGGEVTDVIIENLQFIVKSDGRRYAQVSAKTTDSENTQLTIDIQELVREEFDEKRLQEGYGVEVEALGFDLGQQSENIESFQSLGLVSVISIVFMYVLLVWQFDSFSQPMLIIFVALVLAMPGVFIGLYSTDNYMSFLTAIGLIGLVGIVVNNTIMLVDFANQYRVEKNNSKEAIVEAIRVRFRPLVTTTVTTIFGLVPLAMNDPFWEPISYTIIFGLISSTTLVILAFPAYYLLLEELRTRFKNLTRIG